MPASIPGDSHVIYKDRTALLRAAYQDVFADRYNASEHVFKIPGNSDFLHRLLDFAMLHPKTGGAA